MSRDICHQARVLRAPSNLALSTAREGAATASLGNLFHLDLHTATDRNSPHLKSLKSLEEQDVLQRVIFFF